MPAILNAISHFSILRGVLSPEAICKIACEKGYKAIALTDHNNLYGLPSFLHWCKEYKLTPLIGAELVSSEGCALLYAEANEGFSNLCRIISERHCNDSFNLINSISSDCAGIHVATDSEALIVKLLNKCQLYYRMTRPHRIPQYVKKTGIKSLIAPAMVFRNQDDWAVHKMLRAIDCNSTLSRLSETEILDCDSQFTQWEIIRSRFEVFEDAIKSTEEFADRLNSRNDFGLPLMPVFPCKGSSTELLRQKAFDGACKRYGDLSDAVVKRLNYELDLIGRKGFSDYFLIVDDIVKQSPRTCGRGSGAASIVAFSLGITNVDPIRYNLMFERFLNPGRTDPPDIDVDFAWDERDNVLKYVFDRFGKSHTAMVSTHLCCGARMAIRETARIYGLTESEISAVTGRIPYFLDLPENAPDIKDIFNIYPALKNVILDPPWPQILSDASRIIGMPRGIGTHCGGVVITPKPVNTCAPVQYSAKGFPIVQWEKDGAEEMGLVKIDLLGNRSLAVIRDAIINIKNENIPFDEFRWDPQSDPRTIDLLARGATIGVFYTESPAMRLLQQKTGAGDFEHMVIHSSIIRPAANKYIKEYIRRLKGGKFELLHPSLNDTLSETYGIMVYQEDVSKVAMAMAGFSVEDADMLRKIMSKKTRGKKFNDYREMFFKGAADRGVDKKVINDVWEMMLSFSGYSFCKPHSASYVQVSFQSAYLKAHFPAQFMAAVISNYGGYYSTQAYVSETQRLGISVIPPDVNISEISFYSRASSVVSGLCQIKGLTKKAQQTIVSERKRNGKFTGIEDFLSCTAIDESDAERLLLAGACDNLCKETNRSQLFWMMRKFFRSSHNDTLPKLKSLSASQFLQNQYRMLGFLTSCHPVTLIGRTSRNLIKAKDINKYIGKEVSFLGWCITAKTVSTKMGESMEFVTFEDETGLVETVFFPESYREFACLLERHTAFVINGKVAEEYGALTLEVKKISRDNL
jgi:DNA-directed DNA polymerase III PolC